jgi:hypothetical protein
VVSRHFFAQENMPRILDAIRPPNPWIAHMPITFAAIRQIALSLDNVVESTSYGTPAFKVGGQLFARLREDIGALVIATDFQQREELMAADPDTYFITDHYLEYKWVLVRLSRVHPDAMRDLLRMAWKLAAAKKPLTSRRARR